MLKRRISHRRSALGFNHRYFHLHEIVELVDHSRRDATDHARPGPLSSFVQPNSMPTANETHPDYFFMSRHLPLQSLSYWTILCPQIRGKINLNKLEKRLWDAANALRANSKLKSWQYSTPVLGLIFLRYADYRFSQAEPAISQQRRHWRKIYSELIIILVVARTCPLPRLPRSSAKAKGLFLLLCRKAGHVVQKFASRISACYICCVMRFSIKCS